ncbi:hypothetical protein YYG_02725 [Plasmodium vinckei petteri]|uniref:Uncharacterized protein n=1 Tax=Plasmodium vinckei petteri TaxID=138298 RepID=W7ATW7_PLAVN|nr:hypothetical protein YYG_02725 [Plasmodium vinckei petteri]CAD2103000.1 conserved Plasmodium protein, unknown function [Plasmodium vinckei petteri]
MFLFKKKNIDKSKAPSNKKLNSVSNAQNGLETKLDRKTSEDSENSSKDKKFFNIKKLKIFSRSKNKDIPKDNNKINVNNNEPNNSIKDFKLTSNKNGLPIKREASPDILHKDNPIFQKSQLSKSSTKSGKSKSESIRSESIKSDSLKSESIKSDSLKSESIKSEGLKSEKSGSIFSKSKSFLSLNSDKMSSSSNEKIEAQTKKESNVTLNSLASKNSKINSKELNKNEKSKNSAIMEKLTLKKIFKSPFNNTSKKTPENNNINEITDLKEKFKHAKSIFDKKIASKKSINSSHSKNDEDPSEKSIVKKIEIFNLMNQKKNVKNKNFFMKKKPSLSKGDPKSILKKKSSNNTNLLNREPSVNNIQPPTSTIMDSGIKEKKNELVERANKIENNQLKVSKDLNNTDDELYIGHPHTNHIVNKQILFNVDPPFLFAENSFALCPIMPISDVIEMIRSICEHNKDESIKKMNNCKENNQKISSTLVLALGALDGDEDSLTSNLNKRTELQKQNLKEAYDVVESINES